MSTTKVAATIKAGFIEAISAAVPPAPEPEYYLDIQYEQIDSEQQSATTKKPKEEAVVIHPAVDSGIIVTAAVLLCSVAALVMAFRERKKIKGNT